MNTNTPAAVALQFGHRFGQGLARKHQTPVTPAHRLGGVHVADAIDKQSMPRAQLLATGDLP